MMNKRKFLSVLILICVSVTFVLLFSCTEEHEHFYGSWEIETAPTFDSDGLLSRTCSCGDKQSEVIPKLSDSRYESHIAKHATCNEPGQMVYHITLVGISYEFFEVIPQLTHEYVLKTNIDKHWKECTHCHEKIEEETHVYDDVTHQCTCGKFDPDTCIEYMNFELMEDDTYKIVSSKAAYSSTIIIPTIYNEKKVTIIGDNAFNNIKGVISITIPNGIKRIGNNAFYNFTSLESIEIPASVKSIGNSAFAQCKELKTIIFNEGLENIGDVAFANCKSLQSVSLPSTIKKIGSAAFKECNNLMTIDFSNKASGVIIGDRAFQSCAKLDNLVIKNVETIGIEAFNGCIALTNVTFDNVVMIGQSAFSACYKINSIIFDNAIKNIGNQAFHNCIVVNNVEYSGTISEWKAIAKDSMWYDGFDIGTVHCSNGETKL